MLRRVVAASAFAALMLPVTAAAQDLMSICERAQHPRVGAWSEFKVVGGRNDGGSLRMSVVGSERRSGTEYFWLEFVMRGFFRERGEGAAGPERMISKMLVPGLGPGMGRPMQTVVKVGDAPAMEMPAGRPSPAGQGPTPLKDCRDAKVIGWESVTVPAGTFRALHVQGASGHGDTWVDPDLPFAMVKEAANDQGERSETVLTGHGMGARSQITERPRPWDARAFMEMVTGRTPPQR